MGLNYEPSSEQLAGLDRASHEWAHSSPLVAVSALERRELPQVCARCMLRERENPLETGQFRIEDSQLLSNLLHV